MRVGFTLLGGKNGTGSYNYILNLITILLAYSNGKIEPIFFVGDDITDKDLDPFVKLDGLAIVKHKTFNDSAKSLRLIKAILFGADSAAQNQFLLHNVDVVFESATFFGWRFQIPAIAWIPDFQHKHLKHLFSFSAYWKREIGFWAQIISGRTIMLSSKSAERDCLRFYPVTSGRTEVVRFSVDTKGRHTDLHPAQVRMKYGLPERYFYLPNQFWKHKNHEVVIKALKIAKTKDHELCVAASGNPSDPRFPELYEQLQKLVIDYGLQDQFIFLGLIPYGDLVALMSGSIAVVNPSLFEGWSTTVEEAKSLGKPLILSDIDVHREQTAGCAQVWHFPSSSPAELSEILTSVASSHVSFQRDYVQAIQEQHNKDRLKQFCDDFINVAELTTRRFQAREARSEN
jgi:glycosyltransferase involved in cell wall biosynthesis